MVKHEDERAFPVTMVDGRGASMTNLGMTMRDYFAARALQSVILSNRLGGWNIGLGGSDNGHIAEISYALADAMLAERAK